MSAANARMAGAVWLSRSKVDERKRVIESGIRLTRIVDDLERPVPDGGNGLPIADRDEGRKSELIAVVPALRDDFRPNPGRVAQGDCQWRQRCRSRRPAVTRSVD